MYEIYGWQKCVSTSTGRQFFRAIKLPPKAENSSSKGVTASVISPAMAFWMLRVKNMLRPEGGHAKAKVWRQ
jgi:hypothetical protein